MDVDDCNVSHAMVSAAVALTNRAILGAFRQIDVHIDPLVSNGLVDLAVTRKSSHSFFKEENT